jgi:hypothetical protein
MGSAGGKGWVSGPREGLEEIAQPVSARGAAPQPPQEPAYEILCARAGWSSCAAGAEAHAGPVTGNALRPPAGKGAAEQEQGARRCQTPSEAYILLLYSTS